MEFRQTFIGTLTYHKIVDNLFLSRAITNMRWPGTLGTYVLYQPNYGG